MSDIAPSENKIQQESVQFNQPVSEASSSAIGALANALREIILPVGSVVYSVLDESTFQGQNTSPTPARWILADGRSVAGSRYETLTGNSTVPDLRGVFLRSKNGARSGTTGNPDGDLAVGTYSPDKYNSHNHGLTQSSHTHTISGNLFNNNDLGNNGNVLSVGSTNLIKSGTFDQVTLGSSTISISVNNSGGNETAPRNVTLNCFIRIN